MHYFCAYMAVQNGEAIGYGDLSFEVGYGVADLKSLTDEIKQTIKDKWFDDRDVDIVLTSFNHVKLP